MKSSMDGVGLVELMISMLLGSLLSAALLNLFLTQQQLAHQVEAATSLSERISFAADFLSRHLMEAGYASPNQAAPYPVGTSGPLAGTDQRLADTLVIFSEGGHGCTDEILENKAGFEWRKFSLIREGERRELRCEDSEGGPYPMLDGVEAMQVLYGVDANQDRVPDYYSRVSNLPADASLVSLRVGLLLRGERVLGANDQKIPTQTRLLDAGLPVDSKQGINFGDGRLRRSVVVTIALRNLSS